MRAFDKLSPVPDVMESVFDRKVRVLQEQMLIGLDKDVAKIPFWSFVDTADSDILHTFLGPNKFVHKETCSIDSCAINRFC